MNDSIIRNSLSLAEQAISKTTETTHSTNWWMWFAIAELGVIAYLLIKENLKSKDTKLIQFKQESLRQEVDFDNIVNSSFNSIQLYDRLKVKCHPDRFSTDCEKNAIAENIFQEITNNKNNVKRLLELKEEAKEKLNINF